MKECEEKLQVLTCVISSVFTPTPLCLIVHSLNFICCRLDCPRSGFLNADLDQKRAFLHNSIRDILLSQSNSVHINAIFFTNVKNIKNILAFKLLQAVF